MLSVILTYLMKGWMNTNENIPFDMSEISYFSLCLQYFDLVWLVCVSFIYVPVIDIKALPGLCHDSVGIVTFVSTDTA